jgi:hypothetical protein
MVFGKVVPDNSRVAGTKIVPWRSSGCLTPALPTALRCCQFFPRDTASRLVATIFQRKQHSKKLTHNAAVVICVKVQLSDWLLDYSPKDCRRHGNTAFTGSDLDGTIFVPATLVILIAHYTPDISLGNLLFWGSKNPLSSNQISPLNRTSVGSIYPSSTAWMHPFTQCSFASQSVSKDV